ALASLGLAGLTWALAPQSAFAWGPLQRLAQHPLAHHPPVTVDVRWQFSLNIYSTPPVIPTAPWYTYFPYDPHLMSPSAGASHSRNGPQPFPPAAAPTSTYPAPTPENTPVAPRPAPVAGAPQYNPQLGALQFPQSLQPVGYATFQPPS